MPTLEGFSGASLVPDYAGALRAGRAAGREAQIPDLARKSAAGDVNARLLLGQINPKVAESVDAMIASADAKKMEQAQKDIQTHGLLAMQFVGLPADLAQQDDYLKNQAQAAAREGRDIQPFIDIYNVKDPVARQQIAKTKLNELMLSQKLLGEAMGGGGAGEAFGTRDYVPAPGKPGFMHPVVYDKANNAVIKTDIEVPEKIVYQNQGNVLTPTSPTGGVRPDLPALTVAPSPDAKLRYDPKAQEAVSEAEVVGREKGEKRGQKEADAESADVAIAELNSLVENLGKLPASPIANDISQGLAYFGIQDKDQQEALGNIDRIGGKMLAYVERLPGAATDRDREVFMASVVILNNPKAPRDRRIAAAKSAIESFKRLKEKYGAQKQSKTGPKRIKIDANGNVIK